MEYGMEDFQYEMEMKWKKIASMEYGKIVFHSIPYHALLGLGRETSSPWKLPCPRLEDCTTFWTVEILLENARNLTENLRRPFFVFLKWRSPEKKFLKTFFAWKILFNTFFWDRLKKILKTFFLFVENTCACVLGP